MQFWIIPHTLRHDLYDCFCSMLSWVDYVHSLKHVSTQSKHIQLDEKLLRVRLSRFCVAHFLSSHQCIIAMIASNNDDLHSIAAACLIELVIVCTEISSRDSREVDDGSWEEFYSSPGCSSVCWPCPAVVNNDLSNAVYQTFFFCLNFIQRCCYNRMTND